MLASQYLQAGESVIVSAEANVDVRAYATNAEAPVPWADLARPKHKGAIALTSDRLLITFNPGNARIVSVPLANVLLAWERVAEGRKAFPSQVVFVLPAGLFCVCELDANQTSQLVKLRRIVHLLSRTGSAGVRDEVATMSSIGDASAEIALMSAVF